MDDVAAQQNSAALDDLVAETSALSATLKRRIKALEAQGASGRDGQIRRAQVRWNLATIQRFRLHRCVIDRACQIQVC
jgi:hypothetical protein